MWSKNFIGWLFQLRKWICKYQCLKNREAATLVHINHSLLCHHLSIHLWSQKTGRKVLQLWISTQFLWANDSGVIYITDSDSVHRALNLSLWVQMTVLKRIISFYIYLYRSWLQGEKNTCTWNWKNKPQELS